MWCLTRTDIALFTELLEGVSATSNVTILQLACVKRVRATTEGPLGYY